RNVGHGVPPIIRHEQQVAWFDDGVELGHVLIQRHSAPGDDLIAFSAVDAGCMVGRMILYRRVHARREPGMGEPPSLSPRDLYEVVIPRLDVPQGVRTLL